MPIIRLDENQHMIEKDIIIKCQHRGIYRGIKKAFIALMKEHFGKQFQWKNTSTTTINISL